MANYLVTGGAGFIGSHIVDALINNGHRVRVLDNLSTGKKENIENVLNKIEFIEGDIRDSAVVNPAVSGIDYILHQAAIPSVLRSFQNPVETLSVNGGGTMQLLIAAKDYGVKSFVYASSSSVYGKSSPYGVSKLLGEQYCLLYNRIYGLNTVCLRYFNVFGPRQDSNSQYAAVIPKFIDAIRNGDSPPIFGDGEQSRDFTYIQNVVEANLNICTPGVYDVGCGESTTVNELFNIIKDMLGAKISAKYCPLRPGDIRFSQAKIDKSIYKPKIDLRKGLELTLDAKGIKKIG